MSNNQEQSRESQLNQNEDQQLALQFMMDLQSQNRDAIEKMIFEDNIEYTQSIQAYFKHIPSIFSNEVQLMFEKMEVNKALNRDLKYNDSPDKRPKI